MSLYIRVKNTAILILCLFILIISAQSVAFADTTQTGNINTKRLEGANRFETAVAVSKEGWTNSDTVVLVNAYNFPDALAGVPFAYSKDAPILLTEKDSIPKVTEDEMVRLKAKNVYILGGEGVVAESVVNDLTDKNYSVERIWGINRFDTATQIDEQMMRENRSDTAILTSAYNFPDALAISSYAAMKHYPILFTDPNSLTDKTKAFIMRWNIKNIIIPGGTGAVSGAVSSELWNSGIDYKQIDGFNRYTTALNISKQYKDDYGKDVMLATGRDFPDALAGGVLAAKKQIPILLSDKDSMVEEVKSYMRIKENFNMYILGGTGAISDNAIASINEVMEKGSPYNNIVNSGYAVQKGDWIYYSYFDNSGMPGGPIYYGSIYKMKKDGSSKTIVLNVGAEFLNIKDDWIYYSNINDYGRLYRVKTDGSQNEKVPAPYAPSDYVMYTNIVGDNIYYHYSAFDNVVKTDINGHIPEKTNWEINNSTYGYAREINVAGDWIYYTDGDNGSLYRMTTSFDNKTLISGGGDFINVYGDSVYYANGEMILRADVNNPGQSFLINNDGASSLNVADGWIYYSNKSDGNKLYKMSLTGSDKTKITDFPAFDINITEDWIFYISNGKTGMIHR